MLFKFIKALVWLPFLFFISETDSFAQYHFVQATVLLNSGDSLMGWIDDGSLRNVPHQIRFKKTPDDSYVHLLSGCDVKEFKFLSGEIFFGYCGMIDSAHSIEMNGSKERRCPQIHDSIFLQPLVTGTANLFYGIDERSVKHFFLSTATSPLEELHYFQFIYHEEGVTRGIYVTSSNHMINEQRYKQQMLSAFKNCQPVFENLADVNVPFTKKGLAKWFNLYNACPHAVEKNQEAQPGLSK